MTFHSTKSKAGAARVLFVTFAVILVVGMLRIPFLPNILIGEEGSHAYLVLDPSPAVYGLDAIVVGRIDGIDRLIFLNPT